MYDELLEKYIDMYQRLLYKITRTYIKDPFECENILQDTYLSFFANIEKYQDLPENDIKNILCKITLNKCRDYLKSAYVRYVDTALDIEQSKDSYEIDAQIDEKEKKEFILKMLNSLNEPYCTLLKYYYIEEKKLDEIAKLQETSKQVIKVQIHRGKLKLKELIMKNGGALNL